MNANVAARVRLHRRHRRQNSVVVQLFYSISIARAQLTEASFCCRLLDDDDDDDDGFFKNHSSLFCKALTFSLLERRTDDGLTSYSLSLFLSRTNEQKHSLFNAINAQTQSIY